MERDRHFLHGDLDGPLRGGERISGGTHRNLFLKLCDFCGEEEQNSAIVPVQFFQYKTESSLEALNQQEKKYAAELDAALTQYTELQQQAAHMDAVELDTARQAMRIGKEQMAVQGLRTTHGKRLDSQMLAQSKKDVAALLDETVELTSIRQQLQKIPENNNNRHNKRKQDQERYRS